MKISQNAFWMAAVLFSCSTPLKAYEDLTSHSVISQLIARSNSGENPVDLSFIGSKVCFAPEGSFAAKSYGQLFYPGLDTAQISSDIPSEGVWFLFYERAGAVRLLMVSQQELQWPLDESQLTDDAAGCGKAAIINAKNSVRTIEPLIDKSLGQIRGK